MATTTGDTINGPFKALNFTQLTYVPGANASYNTTTGVLTVTSGSFYESLTLNNSGLTSFQAQNDGNGGTTVPGVGTNTINIGNAPTPVCFASGTLIRTARDGAEVEVAVEALTVGDIVITAAGARRPIRWIGSRRVNCCRHLRSTEVMPIRVRAGAFGPGKPARDLVVSPGHALAFDVCGEVLVPALALVNGTTIVQEDVASVTYWHVELDSHDLLVAEGVPAESYLDMDNRSFFAESGVVDMTARPDAETTPDRTSFCRPFHGAGPVVEAIRLRIGSEVVALDKDHTVAVA